MKRIQIVTAIRFTLTTMFMFAIAISSVVAQEQPDKKPDTISTQDTKTDKDKKDKDENPPAVISDKDPVPM
jgi:hypothetical protein